MIIFGFRTYVHTLAIVAFICNNCHNPAAQRIAERVRKFTLFFIPLFPISKTRSATCTFCGLTSPLSKDLAAQYIAVGQPVGQPAGQPEPYSQSQPPQSQQYPQ